MYTVGVDIGGMSIKVGLVDKNGKILLKNRKETAKTFEEVIKNISIQIEDLLNKTNLSVKDLSGIGVGCPGVINSKDGIIEYSCNLKWSKAEMYKEFKKYFDLPVRVSNDANVAALAEAKFGSAKGYKDSIMFTLGTGVGGGIVINGELFEGGSSMGAELGHVTLISNGKQCSCGRKGCIEAYASASALISQTKEAMQDDKHSSMWEFVDNDIMKVDGRTSFECAKQGDKTANVVVDNYVSYLSEGILSMLNIFRPEVFVIGGGISAQGDYLTNKITDYCEKFDYGYKYAPKTKIVTATMGNDAGIIGAAALLM